MMNRVSKSEFTRKREYFVTCHGEFWTAGFRPLNPRTGLPWQASRQITDGHDVWAGFNYRTQERTLEAGPLPPFDEWSKRWTCVQTGFSTEALAKAAVEREKERSGK